MPFLLTGFLLFSITVFTQPETRKDVHSNVVWTTGQLNSYNPALLGCSDRPIKGTEAYSLLKERKTLYFNGREKSTSSPNFIIPVNFVPGSNDPGFFTITSYFDHDPTYPDHVLDYECGDVTFDNATGYNHGGTDFFPWPYPWRRMYQEEVDIRAAAGGTLILKQDGNFDQQCDLTGEPWNGVAILHEDGSSSWYIHMKKESLTQKEVGEEIEAGEYLGIVGSSGDIYAPHLHFEVYNDQDELIDPFEGPCNPTVTESWWENQLPYLEPAVNKISTHSTLPLFPDCPLEEVTNESGLFHPGDTIWLLSYFRNIFPGDAVEITISRPDNTVFANWDWTSTWEFYTASWLYFYIIPGEEEQKGEWDYQLTYKEVNYHHPFQFLNSQSVGMSYDPGSVTLSPNPVTDEAIIRAAPGTEIKEIDIWDMKGNHIRTVNLGYRIAGTEKVQVDTRSLEAGVYILRVISGSGIQHVRLVKQRGER